MRWALLIALVIAAHIGLWMSEMAPEIKLRLTLLNAAGWAVVLVPTLFVNQWLKSIERRNRDGSCDAQTARKSQNDTPQQ